MTPRGLVYQRAIEMLGDQWWEYEKAIWEIAKIVPPNLAVRQAEKDREVTYLKEHPGTDPSNIPPRKRPYTTDRLVKTGSRAIARRLLAGDRFEQVRNERGQRLVRIFDKKNPTPIPEGYSHCIKARSKYVGMPREQILADRAATHRKGIETRLRNRGLDPATYVTKREQAERRREWWNSLSPEERHKFKADQARRSWQTRLKRKEESNGE